MKGIIRYLLGILFAALVLTSAAPSAEALQLSGGSGTSQLYLQYENVSISAESSKIVVSSSSAGSYVLSENAENGVFYTKSHAICFGTTRESSEASWFSYDVNSGEIKPRIIPNLSIPFWGDSSGLYYSDYAGRANIFCFNPRSGKTRRLMSSVTGKPCGYVDGKLICLDTSKNRVISYDKKKKMSVIISSDNHNILDCTIVNKKIYVSRSDGFYRIDDSRLVKLYDKYAPIIVVSEPYFVNVMSDELRSALQGRLRLHLNNAETDTQARITNNVGISASRILDEPGISSDGNSLTFGSYSFPLPSNAEFLSY